MTSLIGVIFVSPLWGAISSQLLLQSWLALVNFIIHLMGLVQGRVERKINLSGIGTALVQMLLCSALLYGVPYLLMEVLSFGYSMAENVVYWIFAALSILYMLPEIPAKVRKSWRNATVVGSLEVDTTMRKLESLQTSPPTS